MGRNLEKQLGNLAVENGRWWAREAAFLVDACTDAGSLEPFIEWEQRVARFGRVKSSAVAGGGGGGGGGGDGVHNADGGLTRREQAHLDAMLRQIEAAREAALAEKAVAYHG